MSSVNDYDIDMFPSNSEFNFLSEIISIESIFHFILKSKTIFFGLVLCFLLVLPLVIILFRVFTIFFFKSKYLFTTGTVKNITVSFSEGSERIFYKNYFYNGFVSYIPIFSLLTAKFTWYISPSFSPKTILTLKKI